MKTKDIIEYIIRYYCDCTMRYKLASEDISQYPTWGDIPDLIDSVNPKKLTGCVRLLCSSGALSCTGHEQYCSVYSSYAFDCLLAELSEDDLVDAIFTSLKHQYVLNNDRYTFSLNEYSLEIYKDFLHDFQLQKIY